MATGNISTSDHRIISFEIKAGVGYPGLRRNPRASDWIACLLGLRSSLTTLTGKIRSKEELEIETESLEKAIVSSSCSFKECTCKESPLVPNSNLVVETPEALRWKPRLAGTSTNNCTGLLKKLSGRVRSHCNEMQSLPESTKRIKVLCREDQATQIGSLKKDDGFWTTFMGK